jgi:hypothetical protein
VKAAPHWSGAGHGAAMANYASTRTTQLYDRRRDEVNLDEVVRISNLNESQEP